MVYGMIRRHGAELEIDSEPGVGTKVRLIFPFQAVLTDLGMPNIDGRTVAAAIHMLRKIVYRTQPITPAGEQNHRCGGGP
jgi:CheY-like chemotaxis protein